MTREQLADPAKALETIIDSLKWSNEGLEPENVVAAQSRS